MTALPQILQDAAQRHATEVILEAGQPPLARREGQAMHLGAAWSERELFDALEQVLEPEQLAELAVGNVVEFSLEVDGRRWTLLGEPSSEGVVVRGRLRASANVELGAPLLLPPLAPFRPPEEDIPPVPVQEGRVTGEHWSQGLGSSATGTPDWLIGNSEGRGASAPVPLDDTGEVFDFAAEDDPGDDLPELIEPDWTDEGEVAMLRPVESEGTVSMRRPPETLEDLRTPDSGEFAVPESDLAAELPTGALCWIRGHGVAEQLLAGVSGPLIGIDERDESVREAQALARRTTATFVVRREDPSTLLGWLLRRLEEGSRVVVETRARTAAGARRVLLGVGYGLAAEAWLDAMPMFWWSEDDGEWRLEGPLNLS